MIKNLFKRKEKERELIDTLTEHHKLNFNEGDYEVLSYGGMSKRQYYEAREDYLIEAIISNGFKKLAYFGASYGLQPMRLSNYGFVLAFEPVNCIYNALVNNIHMNQMHNTIPIKIGLGIIDCYLEIKHSGHKGGTPSLTLDNEALINEEIRLISLQSNILNDVDTIVMDIEGYEFECLTNLEFVHDSIKSIFVELHPTFYKGDTEDLIKKMNTFGFKDSYIGQRNEQNHIHFKK